MHYSFLYLLSASLIPELRADIAAGTARNVELGLVAVVALRTLPDELAVVIYDLYLAVVAAALAVVALGIQLGVHYVVIDKSDDFEHGGDIVLHIRNFNIADSAAR